MTDWVSCRRLLLKLFFLHQVEFDFDETYYEWYESKGLQRPSADL